MSFQFSLQSVLKTRQTERDELRQAVAMLERNHSSAVQQAESIQELWDGVVQELRLLQGEAELPSEQVVTRQRYSEQLGRELLQAQAVVAVAKRKWTNALKDLVAVDQTVKALEKLADRQRASYHQTTLKQERLEFEDSFRRHRRVA